MQKQQLARSLVRQLQERVALDAALGAQFQSLPLPQRVDLTRSYAEPEDEAIVSATGTSSAMGIAAAQEAAQTRPAISTPPRAATPSELGQAAGVGESPITELPPVANRENELGPIRDEALACKKCPLCQNRNKVVFGEGTLETDIVFVGEAPDPDEDRTGRPFVGSTGELFTAMIEKGMSRPRESVYICNILKCRTPNNRNPEPVEIKACTHYFYEQLRIIRPKLIMPLGRVAAQILSGQRLSISKLRGKIFDYRGIPLLPTYHPANILRIRQREGRGNFADMDAWSDLKKAISILGSEK